MKRHAGASLDGALRVLDRAGIIAETPSQSHNAQDSSGSLMTLWATLLIQEPDG